MYGSMADTMHESAGTRYGPTIERMASRSCMASEAAIQRSSGTVLVRKSERARKMGCKASAEYMSRTLRTSRCLKTVNKMMLARASAAETRTLRGETTSRAMHSEVDSSVGDVSGEERGED